MQVNLVKPIDIQQTLADKVEKLCKKMLPAYLMYAIGDQAKANMIIREDFFINIQQHMRKICEGFDEVSVARASVIVSERGEKLLREISSNDPIAVLYVILYSIMKAVDEGVITDISSQPVLYTVMMVNESEDDGFVSTFSKRWVKQKAGELISRVYIENWYG